MKNFRGFFVISCMFCRKKNKKKTLKKRSTSFLEFVSLEYRNTAEKYTWEEFY